MAKQYSRFLSPKIDGYIIIINIDDNEKEYPLCIYYNKDDPELYSIYPNISHWYYLRELLDDNEKYEILNIKGKYYE